MLASVLSAAVGAWDSLQCWRAASARRYVARVTLDASSVRPLNLYSQGHET